MAGSRQLVFRCQPLTFYSIWIGVFAALAGFSLLMHMNPAYQAAVFVRAKWLMADFGIADVFGLFRSEVFIANRKGLGIPNDHLAGRNPVNMPVGPETAMDHTGESFVRLFKHMDDDDDEYLDPSEFKELLKRLQPVQFNDKPLESEAKDNDRMLEFECEFHKLDLDTITKDLEPGKATNVHYLSGLLNWTQPNLRRHKLAESVIRDAFKPPAGWKLGRVFYLTPPPFDATQTGLALHNEFDYFNTHFTNRYYPPEYKDAGSLGIASLLQLLHHRPFVTTRHPPHSSVALVSAVGADFVQVTFRLHAEFQLNDPPNHPFWFTPSFFFGHVTFSRDLQRVLDLDMDIPVEKKLNVDMEWLQAGMSGAPDEELIEVDIGHSDGLRVRTVGTKPPGQPAQEKISAERAFTLLEVELYPFKKVPYHTFPEAFNLSAKENRPVHSVVLWGSLDDQSC